MDCIVGGGRDIRLQTNKIYERNAVVRPLHIPILANSVGSRFGGCLSAFGATSLSEWRRVCAWRLFFPIFFFPCPPNAFGLIFSFRISIFYLVSFSFYFLDIKCFWNVPGGNIFAEMKCAMFRIFHRSLCGRHKWMCDYAALASQSWNRWSMCKTFCLFSVTEKKGKSPVGVCMKMGDETRTKKIKMRKWNAFLCGAVCWCFCHHHYRSHRRRTFGALFVLLSFIREFFCPFIPLFSWLLALVR